MLTCSISVLKAVLMGMAEGAEGEGQAEIIAGRPGCAKLDNLGENRGDVAGHAL
jgi:hypothetical protein